MDTVFSHIALLVRSVEESARVINSIGIATQEPEEFEAEGTKEVYVGSYDQQQGLLLLLEANSEGPYKKALKKRGPSLHHIAVDVLDIQKFISNAQNIGWQIHPASEQTLKYQTAWLYCKGVPTLIEVNQKRELSKLPLKISRLGLPFEENQISLFEGIGLGEVVYRYDNIQLKIDSYDLTFDQIAAPQ